MSRVRSELLLTPMLRASSKDARAQQSGKLMYSVAGELAAGETEVERRLHVSLIIAALYL